MGSHAVVPGGRGGRSPPQRLGGWHLMVESARGCSRGRLMQQAVGRWDSLGPGGRWTHMTLYPVGGTFSSL